LKKVVKLALGMSIVATGMAALVWALNVRDEVDVKALMAAAAPSEGLIATPRLAASAMLAAGLSIPLLALCSPPTSRPMTKPA
jgi:hypothetical protein